MIKKLMTKKEIAKYFDVCEMTIDRLTKKGMPRYKVGIKVMFDLDEVKLWMKERGK